MGKTCRNRKHGVILTTLFVSQVCLVLRPQSLRYFKHLVILPLIAFRKCTDASHSRCITNAKGPHSEATTWKVRMRIFSISHRRRRKWRNSTFVIKDRDLLLCRGKLNPWVACWLQCNSRLLMDRLICGCHTEDLFY